MGGLDDVFGSDEKEVAVDTTRGALIRRILRRGSHLLVQMGSAVG